MTQTETMWQHKPAQLIEKKLELQMSADNQLGLDFSRILPRRVTTDDTDAIDAKNALKGYMNIFQALPIDVTHIGS